MKTDDHGIARFGADCDLLGTNFWFVLCQRGAEGALKRSLARTTPDLRAAYQRPGLVTFRSTTLVTPELQLDEPLVRLSGVSLGSCADISAALERIKALPSPLRLHVTPRDLFRADEAPPGYDEHKLVIEVETALRSALPTAFHAQEAAEVGDLVLDVVVAPGDALLLGLHRQVRGRSPHPGGRYCYQVPSDAPSRAYGKLEEAIAAFALPMRAGDTALELGAAPGGAAYALLQRGLQVIAVDPGDMAEVVLARSGPGGAQLTHLKMSMAAVTRQQLPERVEWLLMDVHLAPQVALRAAQRFAAMLRPSLLGMVLTLKLNDWSFLDQLPRFLRQAAELGLVDARARQLPAHRQEIAIVGLTQRGKKRNEDR